MEVSLVCLVQCFLIHTQKYISSELSINPNSKSPFLYFLFHIPGNELLKQSYRVSHIDFRQSV